MNATATSDTLLGHCLARVMEERVAAGEKPTKWLAVKSTVRAARVAAFVIEWGLVQDELGRDDLSVDDYYPHSSDSQRAAYYHRAELLALFPRETDPNRLAAAVLQAARERQESPSPSLVLAL